VEALCPSARGKGGQQGLQVADRPLGRLVAHAHQDRGRGHDRLIAFEPRQHWRHGSGRVARKAHDQEPDDRVPQADHLPGQGESEQEQEHEIDNPDAAGRKRDGAERQEARDRPQHQEGEQGTPERQRGRSRGRDPGARPLQHLATPFAGAPVRAPPCLFRSARI
jgi:hypothetical protein